MSSKQRVGGLVRVLLWFCVPLQGGVICSVVSVDLINPFLLEQKGLHSWLWVLQLEDGLATDSVTLEGLLVSCLPWMTQERGHAEPLYNKAVMSRIRSRSRSSGVV
jgi:hypothetical protein